MKEVSRYLDYLPAAYQENEFLGGFLLAFERIFSRGDNQSKALGETIAGLDRYFRPYAPQGDDLQAAERLAPAEFLPWLAGWVAFTLREDWDEATQRRFIQEMAPLYQLRGTKAGMQRMLQIYLGEGTPIRVYDTAAEFGFEPPPHFFLVEVKQKDRDPAAVRHKERVSIAIIDQEKPAHTVYALQITIPTLQLLSLELAAQLGEEPLILGQNSLLGSEKPQVGSLSKMIPPLRLLSLAQAEAFQTDPVILGHNSQLGTITPQ